MDTADTGIVLWSPAETAKALDLPEGTLRNWRSRKIGPTYVKLGHQVRYLPKDIVAFVEAQRVTNKEHKHV